MDQIERLKLKAKRDRDTAIRQAREDYHATLADIRRLSQTLNKVARRRRSRPGLKVPSVASLAELILRECGPMTLVEIVVEIRERGLRDDEPHALVRNLRASLRHHVGTFWQDGERWRVANQTASTASRPIES